MEITLETKIYDLLKAYPFLEEELIRINPKFKRLKNPILRRTITKIASIQQAARVGGMDPLELVNLLRERVGQPPLVERGSREEEEPAPPWIEGSPVLTLNANELLDRGENPLAHVNRALKGMEPGELLLLVSDFRPEPLIEEMAKRGHQVYSQARGPDLYHTYILKGS
ncbi:MAG: hypothetical protein C6I00_05400 [Nitratiruptor sp.]|nr:hypothetical protein [Nitratiruptor sp.]NPA83535.1 DUF1858 domain-containing protein [Campylobacterota bacterium]